MKLEFTVKQGNKKLILIFAGWGMDSNPFRDIRLDGHDIAVVWDYRDMTLDITPFAVYSDIYLFAWSFGVYTAARTIAETSLNPTVKIAVNGSLNPVDDREGIPVAIFRGTLDNLSPRNLDKFYRRMCKDTDDFTTFNTHRPCRELDELKEELSSIALLAADETENIMTDWDRAVISGNDRIFPIENLRRALELPPQDKRIDRRSPYARLAIAHRTGNHRQESCRATLFQECHDLRCQCRRAAPYRGETMETVAKCDHTTTTLNT